MKRVDRIAFTEGCYRLDLDLRSWMTLMTRIVGPEFDHGFGVAHLAAGLRLRRRLTAPSDFDSGIEAIFAPDAQGTAPAASARELLRAAVRVAERARGPLRQEAPGEALRLWQGLITGRWSLVDTFTSDGKRYVIARQNSPGVSDPRALNPCERQIVDLAATGESNKVIASTLGLSISTVGMHLASAGRKLGMRSRAELGRLHAVSNELAEVRKLEVGGEPLAALILPIDRARFEKAKITTAERAVAEGILEGASNAEIAARRKTSVRTVANQVAALLLKLEVGSRTELVARFASACSTSREASSDPARLPG